MCSILGCCGPVRDWAAFQTGFDRTLSRGPDESRVLEVGGGALAFHRLAIMGLTESGMQPFRLGKDALVCKGVEAERVMVTGIPVRAQWVTT